MNGRSAEILRKAMIDQACAWQARCLSGEMTPAEKVEFLRWLQNNPHNVREYLETAQMTRLLPRALEGLDSKAEAERADLGNIVSLPMETHGVTRSRNAKKPFAMVFAAAATIFAIMLFAANWFQNSFGEQSYVVPHGEQRIVHLQDGSLIHLNSNSKARIQYSAEERLIELKSGQALFDVARDSKRPFRVRAGKTEVVAIGTRFDVYRRDTAHVTVTVLQGRVEVVDRSSGGIGKQVTAHPKYNKAIQLNVGEQVRAGTGQPVIAKVDANAVTAWMRREISFKGKPLGEVADEFNRYLSTPVYIEDPMLRATRVSGIFSAYDEAAFIAFLQEFEGVEVQTGSKAIRVRRVDARTGRPVEPRP